MDSTRRSGNIQVLSISYGQLAPALSDTLTALSIQEALTQLDKINNGPNSLYPHYAYLLCIRKKVVNDKEHFRTQLTVALKELTHAVVDAKTKIN